MKRLDVYIFEQKLAESRNQAQEIIKKGFIYVNNKLITKPSFLININDNVIKIQEWEFVSRAGYKLKHGIDNFNLDFNNKIVLDIGSSTGGFVDCSLQKGAKLVYALDVGTNQLHEKLLNNPKVINMPNTNIKSLNKNSFNNHIDIITCDVSFISLKIVFDYIDYLVNENTVLLFLIKPQFELNNKLIKNCNYSIKNNNLHNLAINNVVDYAKKYSIKLINIIESPIKGSKLKNTEFIGLFKKCNN